MYISNAYLCITWAANNITICSHTENPHPRFLTKIGPLIDELERVEHFRYTEIHKKCPLFYIFQWLVSSCLHIHLGMTHKIALFHQMSNQSCS